MKRLLRILVYLSVLLLLAGWLYVRYLSRRALPDYDREVMLPGMKAPVTVYRDSLGIPHLYAQNEEDLYRVTGYLEAEDRLWQMDLLRRVTQGRLAEIFGEEYVQTDLLLRSLRIPEKSAMILDSLDGRLLRSLEAFSQGVNDYLERHRRSLPPEFGILQYRPEPWKSEHSLNIIGYIAWNLDADHWATEIILYKAFRRLGDRAAFLLPVGSRDEPVVYPHFHVDTHLLSLKNNLLAGNEQLRALGAEAFSGSNNWAVAPQRSADGHALLANDMHLGLSLPGIWYRIHQHVEGGLHVTGVLFPGEPVVVAGHNERIAWGITYLYADDLDLYREKLNPANPLQYRLDGKWLPLKKMPVTIRVKGGKEVHDTLLFTHRGPLVSRFKGIDEALSMRWEGNDYSNEYLGLFLINRAGNWQEFTRGLACFGSVNQNFNYADVEGHIGLYATGGLPIRRGPAWMVLPGDTSLYDWQGKVPFALHPHTFDPPDHQVSSANNRTVGNDYPYYIGTYFAQFYRIARIRQMLNEKEKLSRNDFARIQTDQLSLLATSTLPLLTTILQHASGTFTPEEQQAFEVLKAWDGNMGPRQTAPLLFDRFLKNFVEAAVTDELGEELTREVLDIRHLFTTVIENVRADTSASWLDDHTTPRKEGLSDIVVRAFRKTVREVDERYGSGPEFWRWGPIHSLTLQHPLGKVKLLDRIFRLNRGPYVTGGSFHTVCPYSYPMTGEPDNINHGASQRHIFVVGDWDRSLSVLPTGESGIPASPHYGDQTFLYTSGRYHPDVFSKEQVIRQAQYKTVFRPEK